MEIDYESQSIENKNYNTDNQLNFYEDFFNKIRPRLADTRNMILGTDPNLGYLYLISNPMYILNPSTYEIIRKISHPDKLKLDNPENVIAFNYQGQQLFLTHSENFIYIYSLPSMSKFSNVMYIEHKITFLSNDERIVKIFNIENELNIPYLLLITSSSKIYLLKISFDSHLQNFDYNYELLTEKVGIFRKFIGNFVSSGEISKVFLLNPFSYTKFTTNNNKKNNVIFLFNESYLKKIEFNIGNKSIDAELTLQVNPINLIIEKLKPHYKHTQINSKNIFIESADIYHDKITRLNKIYFIIKYEPEQLSSISPYNPGNLFSHFYLFIATINHDSNELSFNILFDFKDFAYNKINNCSHIIVNKYSEEAFIFFSRPKQSSGFYFSTKNPDQFFNIDVDFEIRGFNPLNTPEIFSVDILSMESGVWNVFFGGNRICISDKTGIFLSNVINASTQEESIDKSLDWGKNLLNSLILSSHDFYKNEENYPYQDNLDKIIHNQLTNFYEKFYSTNITPRSKPRSVDEKLREHEINSFIHRVKSFDFDQIFQSITKLIKSYVDDEKQNVDNINKESIKAELVIIEYLTEKEKKLDFFYEFLTYYKIFKEVDTGMKIFFKFLELKEKLTVAIKLREFENNVIDRLKSSELKRSTGNFNQSGENFYKISYDFLNSVYSYLRSTLWIPHNSEIGKPFYKHIIFSKISEVQNFLNCIIDVFSIWNADIKKSKEENIVLSNVLITLFNTILSSIKLLHEKYFYENLPSDIMDSYILDMRQNSQMLWLVNFEYLKSFDTLLTTFIRNNEKVLNTFSTSTVNEVFTYSDNLLYFIELYHKIHFSEQCQKKFFEWRKNILSLLVKIHSEKTLNLARKYKDFYIITFICHNNKSLSILKEIMNEFKDHKKIISYILKIYLLFESGEFKKAMNSQKSFEFSFFENFDEFSEEIKEICEKYPKLNFQYEIYVKSRNVSDYNEMNVNVETLTKTIVNKQNLNIVLKIAKVFNILNRCNYEENFIRNEDGKEFEDNFYIHNEKNGQEINFVLLINYLNRCLKFSALNEKNLENIFGEFENFLKNFINSDSILLGESIENNLKYKIAIRMIQLAQEINYKFENKNIFEILLLNVYQRAFIDDYDHMNAEYANLKFESLSDQQRSNLKSKSLLFNLTSDNNFNSRDILHKVIQSNSMRIKLNTKDKILKKQDFLNLINS